MNRQTWFQSALTDARQVFESLSDLEEDLSTCAGWCATALRQGHQILVCGNGGSAAEAQHLVGELMGHYRFDRPSLAAIALSADAVLMSCLSNDYSFEEVFGRQVQGLGRAGDILIVFSTSGNSKNIVKALEAARSLGVRSIAFLGNDGGQAIRTANASLLVRHADTARCQEAHQFLLHCLMDKIEESFLAQSIPT